MFGYMRHHGRDIHTMEDAKPIVGLFLDRDSLEFIIGELPHGDGFTHNLEALLKECDDDA